MNSYLEQAKELHRQVPVVDAHNDLAGELRLRHQHDETDVIRRLYLPHWRQAGIQLIVSSIYIENHVFFPSDQSRSTISASTAGGSSSAALWQHYWNTGELCWEQGYQVALEQITIIKEEIRTLPDDLILVTSKKDLEPVLTKKKIGILLYMEGLDCVGDDITKIDALYKLGVRGASLTWSRQNLLATGCCTAANFTDIPGTITTLGYQALDCLMKHSMFIDISHLNNEGYDDLCNHINRSNIFLPFIATHSNSWTIHPNYRNLTDAQLKSLACQSGILGINANKYIVGSDGCNPLDKMCEHILYISHFIGFSHIGFGFDLCDSYTRGRDQTDLIEKEDCLENHEEALLLTARLMERGISEAELRQLLGTNWLQYFSQILPV